ncbi:alpha/beta hydrolase [Streptomyces violaceusniger]|uniref:TAP domain protein n=1 Tax=Streptomyces violaceusniger (strain Tu 4113) TaxID=653045 RepID=G2NXY0_STRV4|nr:alpha/beta hydrolase [Streptomyces violaceusniger]AEM81237.1 TAP domain protein [Streptomyces violaceusniger Tu 4113]
MPSSPRTIRTRALVSMTAIVALIAVAGCDGDGGSEQGKASAKPSAPAPAAPSDSGLPGSLTAQKLNWSSCPAPTTIQGTGEKPGDEWECATLKAPLDYAKPKGETIDLAMIRAKADGPGKRIGSLVFNFGGPGGSGVSSLPGFAAAYDTLRSRYDLVSFDPRGVGESAGVTCQSDKQIDASDSVDGTPDDDAEVKTAMADARAFIKGCQKRSGTVLAHVDTVSAARDMDLMRQVLGDDKLSYFGISYGTELGGVYAHLFPGRVGRAVLDAVVDPTEDPEQGSYGQAKGFQLALDNYLKDCAKKGAACPTGGDPAAGADRIVGFLKRLDKKPLSTESGRKLTQDGALGGIAAALYDKESWKYLTIGLQEAMQLDEGNLLLAMSDSMSGRDDDGHYSNINAANAAINCVDDRQRYTVTDVKAQLPRFRKASPVFGEYLAWGLLGCTDWPVDGTTDTPDVSAKGSAPILVVGNTGDPATPYEGARKMVKELGEGVGVEVTYKGQGHGAYNSGNACMTKTVNAYLLDGKVPAGGKTCR